MFGLVLFPADVPLAHVGAVPFLGLERLAEKTHIGRRIIPAALIPAFARVEEETVFVGPESSLEGGPRWSADRCGRVSVGESDAVTGQPVQVRGLDRLVTIAAEAVEAMLVDKEN
jgi:hypothetical protein